MHFSLGVSIDDESRLKTPLWTTRLELLHVSKFWLAETTLISAFAQPHGLYLQAQLAVAFAILTARK